jgi:hypothetical protein
MFFLPYSHVVRTFKQYFITYFYSLTLFSIIIFCAISSFADEGIDVHELHTYLESLYIKRISAIIKSIILNVKTKYRVQ